jgi:hypothetical protein
MNWRIILIAVAVVAVTLAVMAVWELIRIVATAEAGDMCDDDMATCRSCVSPQLCAETSDCWAHVFHFGTAHLDTWVEPKDIDPKETDQC